MIVVSVQLASAISDSRSTELARMIIDNVTEGDDLGLHTRVCDYRVRTFKGRNRAALDKMQVQRQGRVTGWRRLDFHVWNLVSLSLARMGYSLGHPKATTLTDGLDGLLAEAFRRGAEYAGMQTSNATDRGAAILEYGRIATDDLIHPTDLFPEGEQP